MKFFLSFSVTVLLLTLFTAFMPINGEEAVYENTVRLHVIANSDNEEDQALKLKIRDEVLKEAKTVFANCSDISEAKSLAAQSCDIFEEAARRVIEREGFNYGVSVEAGQEYYPTREYEQFRLPAGEYFSVRVKIGEADGKNWWCVLFPSLCINSAVAKEEMIAAGFTPNQIRILTESENPKYILKFKFIEIFEALFPAF